MFSLSAPIEKNRVILSLKVESLAELKILPNFLGQNDSIFLSVHWKKKIELFWH